MRGEWEEERSRGRGIVVCSNGGFPPPVSQRRHVTRPDKEWDQELRGKLEGEGAQGGLHATDWPVNQSDFVFYDFFSLLCNKSDCSGV